LDTVSREKRSEIMSRIRSKSGLDRKVHNWLCGAHVRHRMWPRAEGSPDVEIEDGGGPIRVWIMGCFWHMCRRHFRLPKSSFAGVDWAGKIRRNAERDRRLLRRLRREGARFLVLWEHEVRDGSFRGKILEALRGGGGA